MCTFSEVLSKVVTINSSLVLNTFFKYVFVVNKYATPIRQS